MNDEMEDSMKNVLRKAGLVLMILAAIAVTLVAAFAVDVYSRRPLAAVQSTMPPAGLDRQSCVECHAPIAEEWRQSYHFKSVDGPYWSDVRRMGYLKYFDATRKPCINCHAPANVLDLPRRAATSADRGERDQALGVECTPNLVRNAQGIVPSARSDDPGMGVDCVACHVSVHGITGSGRTAGDAHAVVADARFQDPSVTATQLCITCHGSAVQAWRTSHFAAEGITCLDCHMPLVNSPSVSGGPARQRRSHRFLADKDAGMLQRAMEASMVLTEQPRGVAVTIKNRGAGHYLPSGGNWLLVYFRTYDESGRLIRQERRDFGRAEALLLDFWPFASDERIAPGAQKTATLRLPDQGHGRVEAVIRYHDWMKVNPVLLTLEKRF